MKKNTSRFINLFVAAIVAAPAVAIAADEININVAMPAITCGKSDSPNECLLTGEMMARGPANLVKPVKYYCDIRYTYVAAESAQQEIRFNGRLLHHGEITLKNGKARQSLSETITLNLPNKASRIELANISCYSEK